jgi:DNA-binding transcriptional MerR regulator
MAATVNAAAVTRITGVPIGTLNVWVQRGLIPGLNIGTRGVSREFTLDRVLHIAALAALVQQGHGAPFASIAAVLAHGRFERPGAKLIIGPPRRGAYGLTGTPSVDYIDARTARALNDFLDGFVDGRPAAYSIVELDRLAARVRKEFESRETNPV